MLNNQLIELNKKERIDARAKLLLELFGSVALSIEQVAQAMGYTSRTTAYKIMAGIAPLPSARARYDIHDVAAAIEWSTEEKRRNANKKQIKRFG